MRHPQWNSIAISMFYRSKLLTSPTLYGTSEVERAARKPQDFVPSGVTPPLVKNCTLRR